MEYYAALSRVYKCPYCGSPDVHLDPVRGYVVCRACGSVVEDTIVDFTAQLLVEKRERKHVIPSWRVTARYATIVERNSIKEKYTILHHKVKLSKLLNGTSKGLTLIDELNPKELDTIESNKCVMRLLKKLQPEERAAVIAIALSMYRGEGVLTSSIVIEFNVPKDRVRKLIKMVRRCLSLPSYVEFLA